MTAFTQAIVVDVLSDPTTITDKYAEQLNSSLTNIRDSVFDIRNFPRNTLIVRSIHGQQAQVGALTQVEVALPFFSPHICPPIKAGESVWIFRYDPNSTESETLMGLSPSRRMTVTSTSLAEKEQEINLQTPSSKKSTIGYWVSRVATFMQYDDVNYTVHSRAFELLLGDNPEYEPDNDETPPIGEYFRTATSDANNPNVPSLFTNGAGANPQPAVIQPRDEFQAIFNEATSNGVFEFEPVPRFTKRPGDFVLQGSNNTLISLGSDRTSGIGILNTDQSGLPFPLLSGSEESKIEEDFAQFAGTIDIVTGRGRVLPDSAESDPELTAPRIINTDAKRGDSGPGIVENDKDPQRSDRSPNLSEGNPDFALDSSRMYVSMRTNADKNFVLPQPDITDNSPPDFYSEDKLVHVPTDEEGAAFIVTKSDEIRIIARKNDDLKINPESDTSVNGSIKIVKEGEVGEDLAMVIMHPDGTVQIDAPRIILGRNDVGAFDNGSQPGSDQETGYVKFSQYNKQITALHDEVHSLAAITQELVEDLVQYMGTMTGVFGGAVAGPFPVAGLQAGGASAAAQILQSLASDHLANIIQLGVRVGGNADSSTGSNENDLRGKIPDARSDTIFGE